MEFRKAADEPGLSYLDDVVLLNPIRFLEGDDAPGIRHQVTGTGNSHQIANAKFCHDPASVKGCAAQGEVRGIIRCGRALWNRHFSYRTLTAISVKKIKIACKLQSGCEQRSCWQ